MTCPRPHIAFVATVPSTFRAFMIPHLRELAKTFDITIFSNFEPDGALGLRELLLGLPVEYVHVGFERKIQLIEDARSWWLLFRHLRNGKFKSVHSMMPKTGLIAMTAGFVAGVPFRIHMFTGQVWATQRGVRRWLLKSLDRLTASAATHVLADSGSQRDFLVRNGFPTKMTVLGAGSVCGVNTDKFKLNPAANRRIRKQYGIREQDLVFGFLGRMNRDKGIFDLLSAFETAKLPVNSYLMLVGPDEENIASKLDQLLPTKRDHVVLCGHTDFPEEFMAAFNVFCLPSYREGFGTSVIEAAACGVPALTSQIYGLTDAVEERITGIFHPPKDVHAICQKMENLATDPQLIASLSKAARLRVEHRFREGILVAAMRDFYKVLDP